MLLNHLLLSAKELRYINQHRTPTNVPSLSGVGMSLDQVKCTNKSLQAKKKVLYHIVVECQNFEMRQPLQNSCR